MTAGEEYRDEVPAEDGTFWVKERTTGHDWVAVVRGGEVAVDGKPRDPRDFRYGPKVGESVEGGGEGYFW